jgi:multidrug efflux pump subunit AcrA (membrane-fusion protein)
MKLLHPLSFLLPAFALALAGLHFTLLARAASAKQLYTCGMHPQIIKDAPGDCPICGMKLTPVRANGAAPTKTAGTAAAPSERKIKFYRSSMNPGEVSAQPGKDSMGMDLIPVYDDAPAAETITIDPATIQKMNLKTDLVRTGPVRRTLRAVGTVAFDERGLRDITIKYEGWIEQLHVSATWARVTAGEPLFTIYSPDLYNAELNYLVAVRSEGAAGGALTHAARERLRLYDVPDDFLVELARAGAASRTYTYRAPADGIVLEKPAVQGMMVRPGEKILRLADLSTVWVTAQIYEKDLVFVRAGQSAIVRSSYGAAREFSATVDQILPEVTAETRTAQARLTLANPDLALKPGMFVDVRLEAELASSATLVPDTAVLRSGERNTVFVALDGGAFAPREVRLGARAEDNAYEVLSGLAPGERVVVSGQFMLDSESQLREAIQKMLRAETGAPETSHSHPAATPAGNEEKAAPDPGAITPDGAPASIARLALLLADASARLSDDDLGGYKLLLPTMGEALAAYFESDPHASHGPLAPFQGRLPDPADLAVARRSFAPLSTAIADLARKHQIHRREGLHLFECPMAPAVGTGRWLQREGKLRNPFFGSEMPGCGEELDAPSAKGGGRASGARAALPPGHPPIAGMPIVDFLRHLPAEASPRAAEACGHCGMSAAEMAAGEPCADSEK